MKDEIKNECYMMYLDGYEQKDIGNRLNISQATVSRAINSIEKGNDYQLAIKSCGVITSLYVRYQDWIKKKLREVSEIKPDDNRDRLAIVKLENELYKDMLTVAASGDFIENVRRMRDKLVEAESNEIKAGPNPNTS